jgi:hypothetical protein
MSVLGNAKSNRHRKPHEVASGAAGRKSWHLTWGDLCRESSRGVSRGRSSEEAGELPRSEGPKDHETTPFYPFPRAGAQGSETQRTLQLRQPLGRGSSGEPVESGRKRGCGDQVRARAKEEARR